MDNNIGVKINFHIISYNKKTGKINKELKGHNLVVNGGLEAIANLVVNEFNWLAIGTGATAVQATDTALGAEVTRETVTASNEGTGIRKYDHTFQAGSGVSEQIREVGIMNQEVVSGSTMLNRYVAAEAFLWDVDNPLRVIGTISFSNAV